jgi:predicted transcriptional regulator
MILSVKLNFLVDQELRERLDAAAKGKGISPSAYIRMAILAMLAKEKRK